MPDTDLGFNKMGDNQLQKNGLGVAGFIVALVGLVFSWIPLLNVISFWLCAIGIVLSVVALFLKNKKRGMAIAGLICGVAGIVIYYLVYAGIKAAAGL